MIDIKSVDKWAEKVFEAAQKHTRHPKPDGVVHFKYKTYQEFKNSNECFIDNKKRECFYSGREHILDEFGKYK